MPSGIGAVLNSISELRDSLDWDAVNHNKLPQMTIDLVGLFVVLGAEL
jgi:hypothetical protein